MTSPFNYLQHLCSPGCTEMGRGIHTETWAYLGWIASGGYHNNLAMIPSSNIRIGFGLPVCLTKSVARWVMAFGFSEEFCGADVCLSNPFGHK